MSLQPGQHGLLVQPGTDYRLYFVLLNISTKTMDLFVLPELLLMPANG